MTFSSKYKAIPLANVSKENYDYGGKIFLPPKALEQIAMLTVQYPLLFELQNPVTKKTINCGIHEFTAQEGHVYVPSWMMQNIEANPHDIIYVTYKTLPKATYVKLQPQSTAFLDITDPRAVLERELRKHAALTEKSTIVILYNEKEYFFIVEEIRPAKAASIIEADVNVDFSPPVGYVEPEKKNSQNSKDRKKEERISQHEMAKVSREDIDPSQQLELDHSDDEVEESKFTAFSGSGKRISGKPIPQNPSASSASSSSASSSSASASSASTASTSTSSSTLPVSPPPEQKLVVSATGKLEYKTVVPPSSSELEELRKKRAEQFQQQKQEQEAEKKYVPFSGTGHKLGKRQ